MNNSIAKIKPARTKRNETYRTEEVNDEKQNLILGKPMTDNQSTIHSYYSETLLLKPFCRYNAGVIVLYCIIVLLFEEDNDEKQNLILGKPMTDNQSTIHSYYSEVLLLKPFCRYNAGVTVLLLLVIYYSNGFENLLFMILTVIAAQPFHCFSFY